MRLATKRVGQLTEGDVVVMPDGQAAEIRKITGKGLTRQITTVATTVTLVRTASVSVAVGQPTRGGALS
jgi:sulfate adenylyltransferase subunit 1 (EFTu-like GTPase family)